MTSSERGTPPFRIVRRNAAGLSFPTPVARRPGALRLPADVALIGQFDVNVLLVGSDDRCEAALRAVWSRLRAPVEPWLRPAPLPSTCGAGVRTLLVRSVDHLQPDEQQYLLDWLEQPAGRVVSTARESFLPQVRRGDFSAALYYRLNTLCIPLGEHL